MGKLVVVPTPIGNLEDITLRALNVLKQCDLILAEDTRTSNILLKHYNIETRMWSHHKFNEHQTAGSIAERIKSGETVALISDAGTPAISDPGYLLVKACLDRQIEVDCLPGATAFVPALVMSGLPNDRFVFEGFLPQKKRASDPIEAVIGRNQNNGFLRISVSACKNIDSTVGVFGRRAQSFRLARNFQNLSGNREGELGGTYCPIFGKRTQRRICNYCSREIIK